VITAVLFIVNFLLNIDAALEGADFTVTYLIAVATGNEEFKIKFWP